MTYDLCEDYARSGYSAEETAEFDQIETIDAIDAALQALGHATERIGGAQALTRRLADGARWDMVFNIAEGMHGFGRQALVPALLDCYRVPYIFSDPLALAVTLHKPTAKHVVRSLGFPTPDFRVLETMADIDRMELTYPVFVKPVAEGTSKGIGPASIVHDAMELAAVCTALLTKFRQPVLAEACLPGREFTVGIVGTGEAAHALGVMEIVLESHAEPEAYTYANKMRGERWSRFALATDAQGMAAAAMALEIWKALGCRDAGRIDLRCDGDGRLHFLEANPLAGLHPRDSDLVILARLAGVSHGELIARIMASAASRARLG